MSNPKPIALKTLALALAFALMALPATAAPAIEEIVVRARSIAEAHGRAGSVTAIGGGVVANANAEHVHELAVRAPAVWISRGSGEEHLTAIRSAVLTGSGACGAFLFLEDGIPIRPQGFCNVNGLFEVMSERADRVEIVRGPGSALFGGNALHGAVNVVSAAPAGSPSVSIEVGPWEFAKLTAALPFGRGDADSTNGMRLDLLGVHANGWRDDTGFGEQKMRLTHAADLGAFRVMNRVSATLLNQETGGFVVGRNTYRDDRLQDSNPNPEAFRDAWSLRAASEWQREVGGRDLVLTGFARRSAMRFLQHFSPGQPLEENGQTSFGLRALLGGDWFRIGIDAEWADGFLDEVQFVPATGTAFNRETRPVGVHYDFDVESVSFAGHYDVDVALGERVALVHGGRVEYLGYDYDNRAANGNQRSDGTACGFGGCLFSRPADRDDSFTELSGRLGLRYQPAPAHRLHAVVGRGFRPPQANELYRLQRAQTVADLDSETLDSIELGYGLTTAPVSLDVAAWVQRKRHVILRDAAGFNLSDGRTRGHGIDLAATVAIGERHAIDLALGYARHEYDFDRAAEAGELITSGNDEDTAPRWLGSTQYRFEPRDGIALEVEAVRQGEYYVNAANTARYDGHTLVNLRGRWRVGRGVTVFARVMNLLDRDYADRADFAFGNFRYFPGEPRRAFVGATVTW